MVEQEDATGLKPDLQLFTARPEPMTEDYMTKIENCGHQSPVNSCSSYFAYQSCQSGTIRFFHFCQKNMYHHADIQQK